MSNSVDPDETAHIGILQKPIIIAYDSESKESYCCLILPVTLKIY